MSTLRIHPHDRPDEVVLETDDPATIATELARAGVRFERWRAEHAIQPGDTAEKVIAAYQTDIDRLMGEEGYHSVDVVSMSPEHPQRGQLRRKFLSEHTHAEDEVRFFVAGSGLFTLHIEERVYNVLCCQGDLIGVPAGTPHWFDMSARPSFTAIRLFTNPDGWVARFTGSAIADNFPRMEPAA